MRTRSDTVSETPKVSRRIGKNLGKGAGRKPSLTTEQALQRASDEFQYLSARLADPDGLSPRQHWRYVMRWGRLIDDLIVLDARPKPILREEEVGNRADMVRLGERLYELRQKLN